MEAGIGLQTIDLALGFFIIAMIYEGGFKMITQNTLRIAACFAALGEIQF
jgi:hypothetical protein